MPWDGVRSSTAPLTRPLSRSSIPEQNPKYGELAMAVSEGLVKELESTRKFFKTTLSIFEPDNAGFAPYPELYTVASHVAHAADSIDWFIEGAFGGGWDLDFDASIQKAKTVTSLQEAVEWLDRAFTNAIAVVGAASDQSLFEAIPDTRIMEGAPRMAVVTAIVDHTAHHRGSLAVYARLIGKEPPMPYA